MDSFLSKLYRNTYFKYKKYKRRLDKSLHTGQFYRYTRKKQKELIGRVERFRKRLNSLSLQLKLAGAGLALSLMLNAGSIQGQTLGPFVKNDIVNPFHKPTFNGNDKKLTFADLDNDGDLDLAIGISTGVIHYYENVGNADDPRFFERTGALNPFDAISVSSGAAPQLVDFDGDGDFDLVLGHLYGYYGSGTYGEVYYYENDDFEDDGIIGNSPTFNVISGPGSPFVNVYGTTYSIKPALVDIDNDGDLDVFLGQDGNFPSYSSILFFENNSGFSNQSLPAGLNEFEFDTGNQNVAPTFYDYDGDGDFDLFLGFSTGIIRYFKNTDLDPSDPTDIIIGDNTDFVEETGINNPFNGFDAGSNSVITFADLDNDGDKDAAIGNSSYSTIYYFENDGAGAFNQIQIAGFNNPLVEFDLILDVHPTFFDVDGDGNVDAILGAKYEETLFYFRNNGDGSVDEKTGTENPFDNIITLGSFANPSPQFVDIDDNGDFDLFLGLYDQSVGPSKGVVNFYSNDGSNNFTSATTPVTDYLNYTKFSPTFADIDGDGDMDVAIGSDNGIIRFNQNQDIESNGILGDDPDFTLITGSADPFNGIVVGSPTPGYVKPELIDLDHDGDFDVVAGLHGGSYSGTVRFLNNDGTNAFTELIGSANPFNGIDIGYDSDPALVDWDGDGDLDLFVGTGSGEGKVYYFENQNEPPVVTTTVSVPLDYTENDSPLVLDGGFTLSDDSNDDIISAEISITTNYVDGEDVLSFTPQGGVTGSFDTSAGVLSLSGYATLAVYEGILQSVTYENISENPSSAARTIELTAVDFDATYPTGGATININVIPVNDAPAVNVMAIGVLSYTENNPPVVIGPGIVLQDVDNSNLSGATVSMTTNFTSGEDVLVFTNQNGITGVYDPATGVLTLSGTSSVLNYQTALRSVSYQNTSENPVVFTRTISFQADDGMNLSSPDTRSVNVIATNDAPVLTSTLTNPPAYVSGDYVIDNTIAISDLDNLNLNSATISIVSGFASSEDELIFTNQGGISGSYNPSSGVLTLSGSALLTVYRDALRTVVYSNSSTSPVSTGRTIEFIVNDGSDNSNAASITIGFDINQPPVIGAITGTATVGGFITVDLAPFLSDPDNNLDVSTLSIISQPSSGAVASLTGTDLMINYAGLNFTGPDQLMIEVCDLLGLCTQANITINVSNNPPVINPPSSDPILVGTTFSIDLSPFLSDPDGNLDLSTLSIVVQPSSGALAILNGATLEVDYAGVAEFSGTDELTIEVCDQSGVCTQAVITILVEGDMVVNNGISPNGDDKNDYWIIENILLEPENTVSIYSRWGDNIYEVENYNNTTVVFGGLNNNGKEVASGVYFYRIEFKSGRPTLTGSLTIKR